MKVSARNSLKGKVKEVTPGTVNAEIVIEIAPGIEVTSIITKSSYESMGIEVGKEVYAIVKSTDVLIGVD
ncbi:MULTISPECIES: molybdopterin-binding protein [unclassified Nodularia (in: cyanobacteria)]|uniref:TOBE domain-containing protein n=1 Tax=unclassified Nodularia (in: cyanobacteria) TaxID=2656917 RepID=UPI00187EBEC0|nr:MULTISPECIES: molybdopterin-binding protein [unclassified Nodularia (in: cyanobacteria)]MBE9198747.1 TOBE domain-containing protein [Nodularia sp. LEGE 06071]MCC2693965.1 TOBE domain-containing protein [Nodularia sp. LEGE 04288]